MNSVVVLDNKGNVGFTSEMPVPVPKGPEQVCIKVDSCALNPSDILFMRGLYKGMKVPYPYTPGWEGAGVVVGAGPGLIAPMFVGKRVAFFKTQE
jgi:NADPH:quinone reductase-like Zn-dependent oxidoreductase